MSKTLGFLIAACFVAGGLAFAKTSEPEIRVPNPTAPPVPETPQAPRPVQPMAVSVPETPAPALPDEPAPPATPEPPDDPHTPNALPFPAFLDVPGDRKQTYDPGVTV